MSQAPWSLEQLWVLALLAALLAVSLITAYRLSSWIREVPKDVAAFVAAATAAALAVSLLWARPAFVHISMHGPLILESILAFPSPEVHRFEYGQGSYVVLGLVAAIFGRSAEVVMAANACFSAAMAPLAGFLAARWSGRPSAALYASAAWATSPFIARLAHSEDAHVLAVFFMMLALAFAEIASARASIPALAGAVLSILLALWTRQSTYLAALLVVAVLVERRRAAARAAEDLLPPAPLAIAVAVIVVSLGIRVVSTLGQSGDAMLIPVLLLLARHPDIAIADVLRHPFLSPVELSLLVPTLGLAGAAHLARRSPVRISFVAYMAVMTFLTLPSAFRSVGVAWAFRLPLYAPALVAAGVGGAVLERVVEARRGRPSSSLARLSCTALVALVGLLARGTLENRRPDPEFVEYTFMRDTLLAEPRPFTLATVDLQEPSSHLPAEIAHRLGVPVAAPGTEPRGRWIFFESLACHGHSLPVLFEETLSRKADDRDIERFMLAAFDPRRGFGIDLVPRPSGLRAPCAEMAQRGIPRLPSGPTVHVEDDPPMVIYDRPDVTLRVLTSRALARRSL